MFTGIEGFGLGFELAGWDLDTVWQSEMEEDVDASEVFGTLGAEGTLLWPTAAASDYKGVSQPGQRRGQLEEAVRGQERLWPTPGAADGSGKGARADAGRQDDGSWRQVNLVDAVAAEERALWPTPNAADGAGGRTTPGAREGGPPLAAAVNAASGDAAGSLNPRWVEWLMGYPPGWTTVEFVPAAAEEAA